MYVPLVLKHVRESKITIATWCRLLKFVRFSCVDSAREMCWRAIEIFKEILSSISSLFFHLHICSVVVIRDRA